MKGVFGTIKVLFFLILSGYCTPVSFYTSGDLKNNYEIIVGKIIVDYYEEGIRYGNKGMKIITSISKGKSEKSYFKIILIENIE